MDIITAHDKCSYHRKEIETSKVCYCFYCLNSFSPAEIFEWIDDGQTALCPKCGIDSILGDASGIDLTEEFIKEMSEYWFGRPKRK